MTATAERIPEAVALSAMQRAVTVESKAIAIWTRLVSLHALLRTLTLEEMEQIDMLTFRNQWGTRLDAAEREAEALTRQASELLAVLDTPVRAG